MRLTPKTTARRQAASPGRASATIGRRLREPSDGVHAAGDEGARRHGWQITKSRGLFGFGARTNRDPRLDGRRRHLSKAGAQVDIYAASALDPGQLRQGGEREPDAYVHPALPDTSQRVASLVCSAIGDRAREVKPPRHGWDDAKGCVDDASDYERDRQAGE